MIRINLLPYRTKLRQRQILSHIAVFLLVVAATVFVAFVVNVYESMQLDNRVERQIAMDAELKILNDKIGELDKVEAAREEVQNKLKIVDELKVDQFRSLNLLVELSRIVPQNVWLVSLVDGQNDITLEGRAGTSDGISEFMRALNDSEYFQKDSIRLGAVSRKVQDDVPVRAFDLRANFAQLDDAKSNDAAKGGKK